jgi:hypothetical protein
MSPKAAWTLREALLCWFDVKHEEASSVLGMLGTAKGHLATLQWLSFDRQCLVRSLPAAAPQLARSIHWFQTV